MFVTQVEPKNFIKKKKNSGSKEDRIKKAHLIINVQICYKIEDKLP